MLLVRNNATARGNHLRTRSFNSLNKLCPTHNPQNDRGTHSYKGRLMQALILAGGKGTRLAERLAGKPKPLVDICGIPLLERQICTLQEHGIEEILVLVNHAADQIRNFFKERDFCAKVTIIDDGAPRGTAGAVLACLDLIQSRALIVYGDTLFDIDIAHMLAAHNSAAADVTLLLHPNDHPIDSDLVAIDADGYLTAFHAYPHPSGANLRNLVNAAFYVVEKEALTRWRDIRVPSDFGHDLFPAMLAAGQRLFGYLSAEYIKDLGTPTRLDKVERHLVSGLVSRASRRVLQRAVFIDRDGTLNRLAGHIATPEAIEMLPGAAAGVRRLNDAGIRTVLITNQPVIARGECDLPTLERIHGRLEILLSEHGGYLDRIYFCPHHPHKGYPGEVPELKIACECRKPEPGMIERAIDDLNIDRNRSWMVGDSSADMLAANRAGLLAMRVRTGEGDSKHDGVSDMTVKDFATAAKFITEEYPMLAEAAAARIATVEAGSLVLVDDPSFAAIVRNELRAAGHTPAATKTQNGEAMLAWLSSPTEAVNVMTWPVTIAAPQTSRAICRINAPYPIESRAS